MVDCDCFSIVLGLATIVVGAVVANHFFGGDKKKKNAPPSSSTTATTTPPTRPRTLLDPTEKYLLPLIEKEEISHDTRRYRFGLPSANHVLGLPIGQHIHLIATINGELIIRAYTPVSSDDDAGYVDLVIKVYKRNVHPKFPDGGKMSQYVDALNIGDTIAFRGPTGRLQYLGNGKFSVKKLRADPAKIVKVNNANLIAGGTGITPMLQLARDITKNENDNTKLALLFANQTEDDILLRKELDELSQQYPDRFKVWYTLDNVTDGWKYSKGFVNEDMIRDNLYPPSGETITLMCGPPPMINFACQPNLEKLGYEEDRRFAY